MTDHDTYKARVEVEMSLGWALENFGLFVDSLNCFNIDYPATHWTRSIDTSRAGFMTLTARRIEVAA
jgi:hypothetical protein